MCKQPYNPRKKKGEYSFRTIVFSLIVFIILFPEYHTSSPTLPYTISLENVNFTKFTPQVLVDAFGHIPVHIGQSTTIAKAGRGRGPMSWRLSDAYDAMYTKGLYAKRAHCAQESNNPFYVLDNNNVMIKQANYFADITQQIDNDLPRDILYFTLGTNGSGTPVHQHGLAWSLQLYGQKHWIMFPPEEVPTPSFPETLLPVSVWAARQTKGIHHVTTPGELLIIPSGFFHATLNIMEGVSISGQEIHPSETAQKALAKGDEALSKYDYPSAIQYYKIATSKRPRASNCWNSLGLTFGMSGRYATSIITLLEAVRLSPFYIQALENLATALFRARLPIRANKVQIHDDMLHLGTILTTIGMKKRKTYANIISKWVKHLKSIHHPQQSLSSC